MQKLIFFFCNCIEIFNLFLIYLSKKCFKGVLWSIYRLNFFGLLEGWERVKLPNFGSTINKNENDTPSVFLSILTYICTYERIYVRKYVWCFKNYNWFVFPLPAIFERLLKYRVKIEISKIRNFGHLWATGIEINKDVEILFLSGIMNIYICSVFVLYYVWNILKI